MNVRPMYRFLTKPCEGDSLERAIQDALKQFRFDGWLLYDFRGSNMLAQRVLQLPADFVSSRRFLYFVPTEGPPQKLVHRIENDVLDHLPGNKTFYLKWQELEAGACELHSLVVPRELA